MKVINSASSLKTRRANEQIGRELLAYYDAIDKHLPNGECICTHREPWPEQPELCYWCGGSICTTAPTADKPATALVTSRTTIPERNISTTVHTGSKTPSAAPKEKITDMAATVPAIINPQVPEALQKLYDSDRQDFQAKLEALNSIKPEDIRELVMASGESLMGQQAATDAKSMMDQVVNADAEAKQFLAAFAKDEKFGEQRRLIKALKDNFDDLCQRIEGPARAVRQVAGEIIKSHQLALDFKVNEQRREAERAEREAAERQRQADLEELKRRQEEQARLAAESADPVVAKEAETESKRLEAERIETASAPITPTVVSESAVPAAALRSEGVAANFVFRHFLKPGLTNWRAFLQAMAAYEPTIAVSKKNPNESIVTLPGIVITVNQTGRKKINTPLPGCDASRDAETRNRR